VSAPNARTVVLGALRASPTWTGVGDLARRSRLPLAEVRRALGELAEFGVAERMVHEESGRLLERWRSSSYEERRA
jgi:DNA-binding IclR family transcriptional regulator